MLPSARIEARVRLENFLRETVIQPGLQTPTLVSSYDGSIDRILFALPSYSVNDSKLVPAYQSIIQSLRKGTKFVVVHHKSSRTEIEHWFAAAGHQNEAITYVPLPDYVSFTDWAEDAYVAVVDAADGTNFLVEPWEFGRAGDALIADSVQEYASIRATQAPLIFQGGNCLIGDEFWLLGKDYFADTTSLLQRPRPPVIVPNGMTVEGFARQLFSEYVDAKRKLMLIGLPKQIPLRTYYGSKADGAYFLDIPADGVGTYQPIFHIDMFISLIGRAAEQFEVMVGSPAIADEMLSTNSPFALAEVYDAIAKDLAAAGMKVHRNPLVHRPTLGKKFALSELHDMAKEPDNEAIGVAVKELIAAGAQNTTQVTIRNWHHITWNNCLVENSATRGKHVYLPTFGHGKYGDLKIIDVEMKSKWEKIGFTVHLLGDFNEFARRQGVVHCIKKYIERSS